jgi:hypothetical protein
MRSMRNNNFERWTYGAEKNNVIVLRVTFGSGLSPDADDAGDIQSM